MDAKRSRWPVVVSLSFLTSAPAFAELLGTGPEIAVNHWTTGSQGGAQIVRVPGGGFVVVWSDRRSGATTDTDISARRFDNLGAPIGSQFMVNDYTTGFQGFPTVSSAPDGSFVVVWHGTGPPGGDAPDVHARRFDAGAAPLGAQFRVNEGTVADQDSASVGHDGAGNFLVAWLDSDCIPGHYCPSDITFRRFDATGTPLAAPTTIAGADAETTPAVGVRPGGEALIVWRQFDPVVYAARRLSGELFDADDTSVATFAAATDPDVYPSTPSIAVRSSDFVVVYGDGDVFGVVVDTAGAVVASDIVLVGGPESAFDVDVAAAPDDRFVVAWSGFSDLKDGEAVRLQRLDSTASPLEDAVLATTYLSSHQLGPEVTIDSAGNVIVAFGDNGFSNFTSRDGDQGAIFANRFCDADDPTCDICPAGDDTIDADNDGIPDACDACTNLSGAADFTVRPRLSTRNDSSSGIPLKSNRLRLQGELSIAGGFAGLDPVGAGARVLVETPFGGRVADMTAAAATSGGSGTAGWQAGNGKWTYFDRTSAPDNGLRKIVISDRSDKAPDRVRISVKAGGGVYPTREPYVPLRGTFVFGGQAASDAGACAQTAFSATDCTVGSQAISCKQ
jgi:hypothetical protein